MDPGHGVTVSRQCSLTTYERISVTLGNYDNNQKTIASRSSSKGLLHECDHGGRIARVKKPHGPRASHEFVSIAQLCISILMRAVICIDLDAATVPLTYDGRCLLRILVQKPEAMYDLWHDGRRGESETQYQMVCRNEPRYGVYYTPKS